MSDQPEALRQEYRIVLALGAAVVLATLLFVATGWSPLRFVIATFAFFFAVAGMIYRADSRAKQKHTVK